MKNKNVISKALKILSSLLIAVLMVGVVSNNSFDGAVSPVKSAAVVSIWGAPSTVKINKDTVYSDADKGASAIEISMSRNEKEGAQIIITPTKDVSYDVVVSDLTCGNKTIPAENIEVFNQHYMQTATKSNNYYQPGWYPDAIIPFANAKNAGENKAKAGENQGVWFRVETTEDTVAGTYTGNFELTVDGTKYNVPVTVNVWDFAIPEYEWHKTMFNLWLTYLTQGEYAQTMDMWKKYFDFFLDYGITCNGLMIDGTDAQSFINYLDEYYDKISSYNLPSTHDYSTKNGALNFGFDFTEAENLVKAIVKHSVEKEKDYLEKAYIYNFYIDEYHATWAFGDARIKAATYFVNEIKNTWKRVEEYFDITYGKDYIDRVEGLRESLHGIGILSVNADWIDGTTDLFNVWCPNMLGVGRSETYISDRLEAPNSNLKEVWTYTTIGCDYPNFAGYQIDDPLVDERIMSWQHYDMGIAGNMMWAANLYTTSQDYGKAPGDEWVESNRSGSRWNGDGFQVYPGYKYGIDGPIGTIRLENIRDGMEEMKYLRLLENLYNDLSDHYGLALNNRNALQPTYDSLYTHTTPNYDVNNFEYQRQTVAKHILRAQGDAKLAFVDYKDNLNDFEISVVIDKDYTITSNQLVGETKFTTNGNGKIYTFKISKNVIGDINLVFDYTNGSTSESVSLRLAEGGVSIIDFNKAEDLQNVTIKGASGTAVLAIEEVDGVTAQKIKFKTYTGFDSLINSPYFQFETEYLLNKVNDFKCLYIDVYNANESNVNIEIYTISSTMDNIINVSTLKPKQWTRIKLSDVGSILSSDQLRFAFANGEDSVNSGAVSLEYNIYISRLAYSAK